MKQVKTLLSVFLVLMALSVSFAKSYSVEEKEAYDYSYWNSITTMDSINNADMWWNLTRIAMAKMLSNYAINILWLTPDETKNCYFSDVSDSLDSQYDSWVTKACQLGLMWVWIEEFNPNWKVTRAEFGTVLSRALNAESPEILEVMNNASPYYDEHLKYLKEKWIMNNISNPGSLELRWWVMLMLMRADEDYENSFQKMVSISKNRSQEIFDVLSSYRVQKREYDISTNIDFLGVNSGYLNMKGWTKINYDSKKEDAFVSFDMGMREDESFDFVASGALKYSLLWDIMYLNLSNFSFKDSSPNQLAVMTTMADDFKWKRFKLQLPEIDMSQLFDVYDAHRNQVYNLISRSSDMVNNEWFGTYNWIFNEYKGYDSWSYLINEEDIRDFLESYIDTIQRFYSDVYAVQDLWSDIEEDDFSDFVSWLSDVTFSDINWYYVILWDNNVVQTLENMKIELEDWTVMVINCYCWNGWLYLEIKLDWENFVTVDIKKNNAKYVISIMLEDWFEINWNMKVNKFSKEDWIDISYDLNLVMDLDEILYDEYEDSDEYYTSKNIMPLKWTYKVTKINSFDVAKHNDAIDLFDFFEDYLWSYDDEYFWDEDL